MPNDLCFCGEELNYAGECWQGTLTGGHQGNCIVCGENALLDGERCCSAECDQVAEDEFGRRLAANPEWQAQLAAEGLI
jgi:predicted nucleic acid-binding Zn ribbon protein